MRRAAHRRINGSSRCNCIGGGCILGKKKKVSQEVKRRGQLSYQVHLWEIALFWTVNDSAKIRSATGIDDRNEKNGE